MADASKLLGQTRRVSQALPDASINDLQHRLNSLAARVAELRDWQNFATSPKREALCAAIRQLADEPLTPPQQAERIKALRAEWNALGPATNQQDRTLADEFNRLAQSAFEPCREYFAEQAETRAQNLQARRDICAQLRGYLQSTDWRSADIKAAEQIMRTARSEWRRYHPVDRKAGKSVDAEFEQLQDELHRHVKAAWDANLERKREIVAEAEALATGEQEIAAKIDAAKALQQRWREVGATPRNPDQKLWQQFRSACDVVFGQREAARADADAATRAAQQACQALLAELREAIDATSVTEASKDFVRQARSRFAKLPQLPPPAFRSAQREFDELLTRYQTLLARQGAQAELDTLRSLRAADAAVAKFEAQRAAGGSDSLEAPAACFVQRLKQPGPAPDLQVLSAAAIRAELLAGVESPASDQELRLQIQVEQLNAGMSRERATPSVMQLAEQWCALGPKYWGSDPDSSASCDALRARLFDALERALGTSDA